LPAVRSFWRILLIWLTVLALPIQGVAAVGGMHCAPATAPAGDQAAFEQFRASDQSTAHHSQATSAEPGTDATGHVQADASQTHPTSFAAKASTPGQTCSACAACCAGAMMPSTVIELACPDLSVEPAIAGGAEPTSFVVSGPERPPRQVLA